MGTGSAAASSASARRAPPNDGPSLGPQRRLLFDADGCQWRLLPHEFPPWGTVYHYFRTWRDSGIWSQLQRSLYECVWIAAGRDPCPSVVIMDSRSVKTTELGGMRGYDGHKRVKGRKRHILVDTLGLPIAVRVEPANMLDRVGGRRLLAGLSPLFPRIQVVFADAGHESRKLADELNSEGGWKLHITKRGRREFKVTGLTWIVERTFPWLGRYRRFSKDYEFRVQSSEAMLESAGTRLMLNRLAPP